MQITVVGSGDASNSAGRGHSCYWLEGLDPAGAWMVDFGGTALMGLKRLGLSTHRLRRLLFTHLHGDHFGGYAFLLIDSLYSETPRPADAPLEVIGPPGVGARLKQLVGLMYPGKLSEKTPPFGLQITELAPGQRLERAGTLIEGFPAHHMDPPEQPLCLRLSRPQGPRVAFSGDTQLSEGLRAAAAECDLVIAECTGVAPPAGRHTTWEEWQVELPRLSARRVLLTHLATAMRQAAERGELSAPPGSPALDFAEDGLRLELPAP